MHLVEVGPRDGLQAIPDFIPTEAKLALIDDLVAAGFKSIEATSFVNPRVIPQMRDARAVVEGVRKHPEVAFSALVPNLRGLEEAISTGISEIGVLAAASESYAQKNTNTSIEGAVERIKAIVDESGELWVRGYVSCAVACPYEGPIAPSSSAVLAERLIEAGCDEVILGDTTGTGSAGTVEPLLEAVLARVDSDRLGVHFHDTYGQAVNNVFLALDRGLRRFDSAVAGLGGSPSAPGSGGNLASEDLVFMLDGLGIKSGVDTALLAAAGARFTSEFGLTSQSKAGRALAGGVGV